MATLLHLVLTCAGLLLLFWLPTEQAEASHTKLRIRFPQRIKVIHHHHTSHHYARSYPYKPVPAAYSRRRIAPSRPRRRPTASRRPLYGPYADYASKYRTWQREKYYRRRPTYQHPDDHDYRRPHKKRPYSYREKYPPEEDDEESAETDSEEYWYRDHDHSGEDQSREKARGRRRKKPPKRHKEQDEDHFDDRPSSSRRRPGVSYHDDRKSYSDHQGAYSNHREENSWPDDVYTKTPKRPGSYYHYHSDQQYSGDSSHVDYSPWHASSTLYPNRGAGSHWGHSVSGDTSGQYSNHRTSGYNTHRAPHWSDDSSELYSNHRATHSTSDQRAKYSSHGDTSRLYSNHRTSYADSEDTAEYNKHRSRHQYSQPIADRSLVVDQPAADKKSDSFPDMDIGFGEGMEDADGNVYKTEGFRGI